MLDKKEVMKIIDTIILCHVIESKKCNSFHFKDLMKSVLALSRSIEHGYFDVEKEKMLNKEKVIKELWINHDLIYRFDEKISREDLLRGIKMLYIGLIEQIKSGEFDIEDKKDDR